MGLTSLPAPQHLCFNLNWPLSEPRGGDFLGRWRSSLSPAHFLQAFSQLDFRLWLSAILGCPLATVCVLVIAIATSIENRIHFPWFTVQRCAVLGVPKSSGLKGLFWLLLKEKGHWPTQVGLTYKRSKN